MRKIRRQFTFFVSGIFSIQSVLASDSGFTARISGSFAKGWEFLFRILQNDIIRQGISLIALVAILYQVYNSLIKKVSVFSESSKSIAIPLSVLSTLAIYWKIPADTISKMFLFLVIALIIIYFIKGIMKVSTFIKGGYSPDKAIKDEKKVRNEAKEGIGLENQIIDKENTLARKLRDEVYDTKTMKSLLENLRKQAESGQKDVKNIFSDTKRD